MGYRPALDGVRAIAVVAVVLFHFEFDWIPGGFLGVDVFFVVSGYLITSLMIEEWERSGRDRPAPVLAPPRAAACSRPCT